jgi:hypothetical protein
VRSVAADAVGRVARPEDLPSLIAAFRRTARDSFPDAALAALGAIMAIRSVSPQVQTRVDQEFVASAPRPEDYVIRRWAEDNWPELAARWGPATPIATGRTPEDYRDLVRRFVLAPDSIARPKVTIETDQRGPIEIELFGPEAPLTVANFLRLIERRFFDGNRWHRVVPGRRLRQPRRRHPRRDQPPPIRRPDARHGALRSRHRLQPVVHQSQPPAAS